MTYEEALDFMFSQLPMYQRVGQQAFKKDLSNIIALCEAMNNPQVDYKSIHIAGTNGKGSTAHFIAAGLQANGLKVGLYTSPHYLDFRERIKINGQFISKEHVVDFLKRFGKPIERIKPSFFEMSVAMAFYHFQQEEVDVAVIETGLGGRLDSTNIIMPIASVITNIGYDHQNMLGNTLPEIAGEKAGIIKYGVPVVVGEEQEEVLSVFEEKARKTNSPLNIASQESTVVEVPNSERGGTSEFSFWVGEKTWLKKFRFANQVDWQLSNLNTALYTLFLLRNIFNLEAKKVAKGIEKTASLTYFIGRWMVLSEFPTIIVDSAHNVDGVSKMVKHLARLDADDIHFVWGMVNDKDISKVLSLLPQSARYYFAKANIPRGMPAKQLNELAEKNQLKGKTYDTVTEAFEAAKSNASDNDVVVVGGSIFVVAEVL